MHIRKPVLAKAETGRLIFRATSLGLVALAYE
jgi:hypothetical protein